MRARGVWTGLGIATVGVAAVLVSLIWTAAGSGTALLAAVGLMAIVVVLVVLVGQVNRARVDGAEADHAARQTLTACGHLEHADVVGRVGGLCTLGMIWRAWPQEHDRILDIMVAWLREHARSEPQAGGRPDSDVATAVRELVDRPERPERDAIDLAGCTLSGCDLRRARLAGAKLDRTFLNRTTLAEARLTGANLGRAVMKEANLIGARLGGAELAHAYLDRADLSRADLSGANLQGARLVGATVKGTDFTGAVLREADLSQVDLMDTVGLTASQLEFAITDSGTRIPTRATTA
jgi:hypothetical protein